MKYLGVNQVWGENDIFNLNSIKLDTVVIKSGNRLYEPLEAFIQHSFRENSISINFYRVVIEKK